MNYYIIGGVVVLILMFIRQVDEYKRGVLFTFGKFSRVIEPGWHVILPIFQHMTLVDIRVKAVDVPDQDAITKDNVSIKVNAVLYFKVSDAGRAIVEVEDYNYAVSQLAQTTMRDVVGEVTLDELLSKRDDISKRIRLIVDKATDPWGIKVNSVELKHVELPEQLKRTIGKEAEAERERRAVIIKAKGEVTAAENMAKAARTLSSAQGALHLRTLQSMNDLSSDQSNTVVFAVPVEMMKGYDGFEKMVGANALVENISKYEKKK